MPRKIEEADFPAHFWSKTKEVPSGCIEWQMCLNKKGYGNVRKNGKEQLAHRVAFELTFGPIQNGLFVCHKCDNPACVNPAHLFLGTAQDNMNDMVAKGRHVSPKKGISHCLRGHLYTPENSYYNKGSRSCVECRKEANALCYAKKQSGKPLYPRPIQQLTMTDQLIANYPSQRAASRAMGIPNSMINRAIRQNIPLQGYKWVYQAL